MKKNKEIRCENCKYYAGLTLQQLKDRQSHTSDGNLIVYDFEDGKCTRFPNWEGVSYDHFCGEFKPTKVKKEKK